MSKLALSQGRAVKIFFNNAEAELDGSEVAQIAMSVDAYKAAINKVEELEGLVREGTQPADLAAATILITGTSSRAIHKFTVTTTFASGEYTFIFVETADNVESLS